MHPDVARIAPGELPLRSVYLPMEDMGECPCGDSEYLRLCASCAEQSYCSTTCQKQAWPSHKAICGNTDRIDLKVYHPLIAVIAEMCHRHIAVDLHRGIQRQILNDGNPGSRTGRLPDGLVVSPVVLGDPRPENGSAREWWPHAKSTNTALKLMRRINRAGNLLPINTAICVALLAELYTTTFSSDVPDSTRVRLTYGSAPISDFGVAKGSAMPFNPEVLAFCVVETDNDFTIDQDPREHYWIYFTTVRGETLYVDCGLHTFGALLLIDTKPYVTAQKSSKHPWVPCNFLETFQRHSLPPIYENTRHFSVLKNPGMHSAVAHSSSTFAPDDLCNIHNFMGEVSGKEPTKTEKDLVAVFTLTALLEIRENIQTGRWRNFPTEVPHKFDFDPHLDELIATTPDSGARFMQEILRKSRQLKKKELGRNGKKDNKGR